MRFGVEPQNPFQILHHIYRRITALGKQILSKLFTRRTAGTPPKKYVQEFAYLHSSTELSYAVRSGMGS